MGLPSVRRFASLDREKVFAPFAEHSAHCCRSTTQGFDTAERGGTYDPPPEMTYVSLNGMSLPAKNASMLSSASKPIWLRASIAAEPRCGKRNVFGKS